MVPEPVPLSPTATYNGLEVVLEVLSFLAQEKMVKLKRDMRNMCKIFLILSSKSQEFIANLKNHIFIFCNQKL